MSKYDKQKLIDEKGRKILLSLLDENYFYLTPIDGNEPDIDGLIRLRDGKGFYLNKYLHYQLKSTEHIKNLKYFCERKVIDFLITSSVPTLLFVVNTTRKKVYWFFFDEKTKKSRQIDKDKKGRTINLKGQEVYREIAFEMNNRWKHFAKMRSYREISESLTDLAKEYEDNSIKCVGLLYLIGAIRKREATTLFSKILNIPEQEINLLLKKLRDRDIITETQNLYLVENNQIGIKSLLDLISDTPIEDIEGNFKKKAQKVRIREQLATVMHQSCNRFFQNDSLQLLNFAQKPINNDDMYEKLEILEKYAFRVPDQTLRIAKALISSNPIPPKEYKSKLGGFIGKSHEDVILKTIEIVSEIRYSKPVRVIKILTKLAQNKEYEKKALEVVGALTEYNLHVLNRIGYLPQLALLEDIEKWGDSKLKKHKTVITMIGSKLLYPGFKGHWMSDYKTVKISFGPLEASNELSDIRNRTIEILKRLYNSCSLINDKIIVLQTLNNASRTPTRGGYSNELEGLVIDNTNSLINFYTPLMEEADEKVIQEVEEQAGWFKKRFSNVRLPKLNELISRISSNTEYEMFKIFYGYEYIFDEGISWQEAGEQRIKSIEKFISGIDQKSWNEWKKRILSVAKRYEEQDAGKFNYFNLFLHKFGKEKPNFALKLISHYEKEIQPFLIHLIAGVWDSKERHAAKEIIIEWIKQGKHLGVCAYIFTYTKILEIGLLESILRKAKAVEDKIALYCILEICVEQYQKNKKLKIIFISTLEKLTSLKDNAWIVRFWVRDFSIFESLDGQEADIVLESLILDPNISNQLVENIKPITQKYPKKIIGFFFKRVTHQLKEKDCLRYSDIPSNLFKLQKQLAEQEDIIVPEILKWFAQNNLQYHNKASNLLNKIFPTFQSDFLQDKLLQLIEKGSDKNASIILSILFAYQGESFLHKISKTFVRKYLDDKNTKNYKSYRAEMFTTLSQTWIVTGEYGMSNAYIKKKEEIQEWKKDKDKTIQEFVKEYEQYLNDTIESTKQGADEDIQLMKRGLR